MLEPSHYHLVHSLLLLSLCLATTTVAVLATPRDSVLRIAAIPCLLLSAHRLFCECNSITTGVTINTVLVGGSLGVLLHCIDLLVFSKLDSQHLQQAGVFTAQSSLRSKLLRTTSLLLNLRGIGTRWQAKHVESSPHSPARDNKTTTFNATSRRRNYLLRHSLIACWQYLFLDVVHQSSLENDPSHGADPFPITFELLYFGASAKQWAVRILITLFSGLGAGRILLDFTYRLCALTTVILGLADPEDWPPLFGSVTQAYSLRRFWTKYWHQLSQWPLTSTSHFLLETVIRPPRNAPWKRHCHVFLVFLASGLLHAVINYYTIPSVSFESQIGCVAFFTSFSLGIAIEDWVKSVWPKTRWEVLVPTSFAVKCIGFFWVVIWMLLTAPWMLFSRVRASGENDWLVPFSLARWVGLPVAQAVLLLFGLMVQRWCSGEL